MKVIGFDHVVLNVADVERSLAWYCDELGLAPERVDEWRRGEILFPSVRIDAHTLIDLLPTERTGENANHLCLVIEPTATGARGKSYAIYPSSQGRTLSAEVEGQLGIYYDEYVRTADGWRFRSRRHVVNPVPGQIEF